MDIPLLTVIVLVPLGAALVVTCVPKGRTELHWAVGILGTIATAAFAAYLLVEFEPVAGYQFESQHAWIETLGISWHLGVDGISLFMVVLTAFLFPISVIASIGSVREREKEFVAMLLLLEAGLLGTFLALDLILFFVFFEVILVPMAFIIGIWGHDRRVYAAVKFFVYTALGSALMLVAILFLAFAGREQLGRLSFDLVDLTQVNLPAGTARWLFAAFALAFAIKVPLFPFHTWLPDAHVEAPTAGSVLLAGVLLKLGTYGFLRFCLTLFPQASVDFVPVMAVLAVIGVIYGALVAAVQKDAKKLVAYSSVSHLGFVVLGTFALTVQGMQGGLIQMVNHGLSTGALFLLVGMLYDRRHTRQIADFGGLASAVPLLAGFMLLSALASAGLPGLNGFVGEFLVLLGSFLTLPWFAVTAALGVILAAIYLLWMYERVFTGPITDEANRHIPDLSAREIGVLLPLAAGMLLLGVYPRPLLDRTEPSIAALLQHVDENSDYDVEDLGGPVALP